MPDEQLQISGEASRLSGGATRSACNARQPDLPVAAGVGDILQAEKCLSDFKAKSSGL